MKQRSATIRQQCNLGISSHIMGYYGILWNINEYYGFISPAYPIHPSSFFGCCRTSQTSSSPGHLISAQGTLPKITTANSRFTRFNRSAKGPKAKLVAPTAIGSSARLWFKQWETHGKTFNRLFLVLEGHLFEKHHFFVGVEFCRLATPVAEFQLDYSTNQLNKQSQMDETTLCTFVIGDSSTRWSMDI